MSALRFLYKKTLKRRDLAFDDLVYPKRLKKLPVVLSPEEVARLIEATPHPMHRAILIILGSAQEFVETRISGCFLKHDEFRSCDRHALQLWSVKPPSGAALAVTDRCPCWNA